ncbi:MAG: class I SAM-dependent methyltransferase, partial [Candidatus Diapherotrites archaeon]|nr:class I SAM-dependent methyltransferase [Candidatus Diapherotrites archaeon]
MNTLKFELTDRHNSLQKYNFFLKNIGVEEKLEEMIAGIVKENGHAKILDIGCGPGRDAKYFSEQGLDVTGIDLTSNFVKMASKNVPNATFKHMDMRSLDFPEDTFDGIWG